MDARMQEGFILQKLAGRGQVFIHSGGTIVPFELKPGESAGQAGRPHRRRLTAPDTWMVGLKRGMI